MKEVCECTEKKVERGEGASEELAVSNPSIGSWRKREIGRLRERAGSEREAQGAAEGEEG